MTYRQANKLCYYCWPLTLACLPPILGWGECLGTTVSSLSSNPCLLNTMFCSWVELKDLREVSLFLFSVSAKYLLTPHPSLKTSLSLLPPSWPTARLGFYLWAGFQRPAVWSGHSPRLQDALSSPGGLWRPVESNPWKPEGHRDPRVIQTIKRGAQNKETRSMVVAPLTISL